MNNQPALPFDADSLCYNIVEKKVIPILGNEIYQFVNNNVTATIEDWYAEQLKLKYNLQASYLTTLTATIEYLIAEKRVRLQDIRFFLKKAEPDLSQFTFPLLDKLLKIEAFQFYINTTTYGDIFKQLLDEARNTQTDVENFAIMEKPGDCDPSSLTNPFLFNLFGSLKTSMTPALLEEEMLECVNLFIEKKNIEPLKHILDAMSSKTLLFIGCTQPSWLTRFMYRNISNARMLDWDPDRRGGDIIVVNNYSTERDEFFRFLNKNNAKTYEGNIAEFLDQLVEDWDSYISRNPPKPKEIFISYSHKDVTAARRLCERLSKIKNIKCWFDENRLSAGNNFKRGIADGISSADLFIPLLSNNSILAEEDSLVTVKGEWGQANTINSLREQKSKGQFINYLMPIAIDDVDLGNKTIQTYFENLSIARVTDGNADETFINQVKQKLNIA